jgi:hypothetical protein
MLEVMINPNNQLVPRAVHLSVARRTQDPLITGREREREREAVMLGTMRMTMTTLDHLPSLLSRVQKRNLLAPS